jgi:hypothetical protein
VVAAPPAAGRRTGRRAQNQRVGLATADPRGASSSRPLSKTGQGAAIRNGDLAVTSIVRAGNATVEVARRQPGSTWLWLIDQPSVLE